MEVYDKIAKTYAEIGVNNIRREFAIDPTFFKLLGEIKNKTVLDLGCGEGDYTRKISRLGASKVVGMDISKEMIELAEAEEKLHPLGITYFVSDVIELPFLEEFDIVTAGMLLHYSKTKEELLAMCKNIYKNLKKGGRFITMNNNPNIEGNSNLKKYGEICTATIPVMEGSEILIHFYKEGKEVQFVNYYWSIKIYEWALQEAGFTQIEWHNLEISKEGIEKFEKGFWDEFLSKPIIIGLTCKK
ncbi:MAG: class I SAM-dependent methyltransferase [Candidatus Micrarchaeia archaeon]|jgi:ubiquinone/menaquinone biosynthesis C-methylase UbiE